MSPKTTPITIVQKPAEPTITRVRAAELMLGHFPVRKVTPLGLLGEYCLCDLRFNDTFTYADHVVELIEEEDENA